MPSLSTPLRPTEPAARLGGIVLMLLGIGLFAFGDAIGKFLIASYSLGQLLLLRSGVALMLLLPAIWRHRAAFAQWERPRLQFARVILSVMDVASFFLASAYLPLADVITYYLAAPIFVTAGSAIFLHEQVGWRRWSAIAIGFCGVLIALQPSAHTVSWPALLALCGSLSFAGLMLLTRSLRGVPDVVLTSSQFVGSLIFGIVATPLLGWQPPDLRDGFLFVFGGAVSVLALLCVNRSLKLAPASVVVPYQYSMILWAVMFGYAVFGDVPSIATLIGATIIIAAGFYIFLRERSFGRQAPIIPPTA